MPDSLREVTDEQFSDGCAITGDGLDKGVSDYVDRWNNVPLRDQRPRLFRNQFVRGFQPLPIAKTPDHIAPFLSVDNSGAEYTVTPEDETLIRNKFRYKGHNTEGVALTGETTFSEQLAWEASFSFDNPVIIDDWAIFLTIDHTTAAIRDYQNTFQWGVGNVPPYDPGGASRDVVVEILVDNPFGREQPALSSVAAIRHTFDLSGANWTQTIEWPAVGTGGFVDMLPAHPGDSLAGRIIRMQSMNIPIPARSRVRAIVILPAYNTGAPYNWSGPWSPTPVGRQAYSITLTVLEEAVSG